MKYKYGVTCAKCNLDIEAKAQDLNQIYTDEEQAKRAIRSILPRKCPICGTGMTWAGERP